MLLSNHLTENMNMTVNTTNKLNESSFPYRTVSVLLQSFLMLMLFMGSVTEASELRFKKGMVMSRAIVLDESTQQPILVEFNRRQRN